jgi:pyridoxamine 5'-phosphate oxidase
MSIKSILRTIFTLGKGVTKGLSEFAAGDDPIALFNSWFDEAKRSGILLPDSMCVATCTEDGRPSARMMLLKGADEQGFVFYTNFGSRKGGELAMNPRAALVLHWPVLERQVRVEGSVEKMTTEESAAYFATRGRGSRIGAWASKQSEPLEQRDTLQQHVKEYEEKFRGKDVDLPPFWGGFRLQPDRIEFWQGRADRLHDRLSYDREGDGWTITRLYP